MRHSLPMMNRDRLQPGTAAVTLGRTARLVKFQAVQRQSARRHPRASAEALAVTAAGGHR